jgi:two-component system cell cycle response regulator
MKKILLIDDSKTQLSSLKLFLSKAGYEIITADDGVSGMQAAYMHIPDIIISDIVMPNLSGYQLCRLLKDDILTKNIPIILLTVLDKKIDRFWGLRAGADSFLLKDTPIQKIVEEIEKHTSNSTLTDEIREKITEKNSSCDISFQSKITEILDQALAKSTIVNEFRNLSEHVLNIDVLNKGIFSLLYSILDYNTAGIFYNEKDDKKLGKLYISINECNIDKNIVKTIKKDFFDEIFHTDSDINDNLNIFQIIENNITENVEPLQDITGFRSKIILPVTYEGMLLGGICLYHTNSNKYINSPVLNIIMDELKLLLRIKWLYAETKFLAITDALTGLYNRRHFQQIIEREFSRSKRYMGELSVILFDIDNFKSINDNYGHQFGDRVLAKVSMIIQDSIRKTDYAARYGGEEIVVILPETDLERAYIPIERIRKKIEDLDFKLDDKIVKVTISGGIASNCASILSDKELIEMADKALYVAKQNGRNRIELNKELKDPVS